MLLFGQNGTPPFVMGRGYPPGQILVSLLRHAPFHDSHQEDSCFQTQINICIKPRSISKQLSMWLVEVVNANKQLSVSKKSVQLQDFNDKSLETTERKKQLARKGNCLCE